MSKSFALLLILSAATLGSALKSGDQSLLDVATPAVQIGCTDMCHHLTSGPCQHPDEHNEVCSEKIEANGTLTCPSGMYECGPRPVRSEPSPPPSKSRTATKSLSATSSLTISISTTSSATRSVSPTSSSTSSSTSSATSTTTRTPSSSTVPAGIINLSHPNLSSGHLVADGLTVIQNNYRISFDITIFGTIGNWGSIFHFTRDNHDCCHFGSRIPALWLWPGLTRFYWIAGNPAHGDEWVMTNFEMDLNREYHVDLKVVNGVAYQVIDGTVVNYRNGRQTLRGVGATQENVKLYMSDPWYSVPNAEVTNFVMVEDSTLP